MNTIDFLEPENVSKGWGYETVIHNSDGYCLKLLNFVKGSKGSFHFHLHKTETWYIAKGEILLWTIDPDNGQKYNSVHKAGHRIHIPAGCPHQVEAREDTIIVEGSNPHSDSDVYRIAPGDSQK